MNRTAAFLSTLAVVLAAPAALAQYSGMRVNVFAVESIDDFKQWMQQVPAPQGMYPGALKEVTPGKRVNFPLIVRGLLPPERSSVKLDADIEFFAPDGRSIFAAPRCCSYTITDRPDVRTAMLNNTATLVLERGDMGGTYSVRATVTDGTVTATTTEIFQFPGGVPATSKPPAEPAVPTLNMGTPPPKNPGRDTDKRDCLALPTPAEVIKCTERR